MAMKRASFLCGVVIVLSLVAGRVWAQSDSNTIVRLYCGSINSGCSMAVAETTTVTGSRGDSITSTYTTEDGHSLSVGIGGSFPLLDRSHIGMESWWLDIDTVNNLIVNLTLDKGDGRQVSQIGSGMYAGWDHIEVVFEPIPFVRTDNLISIMPGRYPCKFDFQSEDQGGQGNEGNGARQTTYSGYCYDTGSTVDSVYLEIYPASAWVLTVPKTNTFLQGTSDGVNEIFSFNSSSIGRNLEVIDMLGRIAFSIFLPPSEAWYEVQLDQFPPGCYFARLGDQVAKFMVPPR